MQAIIFDFGNVVGFFDHAKTLRRLEPYTDMSAEEMFAAVYEGDLEDEFESGRISVEEFLSTFRRMCRLRCAPAMIERAVADVFEPNPEICNLIPRLKSRYRLLLGSNTNALHSRHFLVQFEQVLSPFTAVVLSHDIGVRKPQAGFFQHCQRLAACPPAECLFIDDLPANIEGARAAGLQGAVYAPGADFASRLRELGVLIEK
jgi:HAD superfamily hydrolase (TIGR01509 family)